MLPHKFLKFFDGPRQDVYIIEILRKQIDLQNNKKSIEYKDNKYSFWTFKLKNLKFLYQALKTIKVYSVGSERVFFISWNFENKLKAWLNRKSMDGLCFLKLYFIKQKKKWNI